MLLIILWNSICCTVDDFKLFFHRCWWSPEDYWSETKSWLNSMCSIYSLKEHILLKKYRNIGSRMYYSLCCSHSPCQMFQKYTIFGGYEMHCIYEESEQLRLLLWLGNVEGNHKFDLFSLLLAFLPHTGL